MANMNDVMNPKNKDPKWMTESEEKQGGGGGGGGGKGKGGGGGGGGGGGNQNNNNDNNNKPKGPTVPKYDYKVKMCCPKCEEKVREEAYEVPGVQSVNIDRQHSKVTVTGYADPFSILKKIKREVDKKATLVDPKTESGSKGGGKGEKGDHVGENVQKAKGGGDNNNNNGGGGGGGGGGEKKKKEGGGGGGGGNNNQGNGNGNANHGGGGGGGGGGHGGEGGQKNKNNNNDNQNHNGDGEHGGPPKEGKGKGGNKGGGGGGGGGGGQQQQQQQQSGPNREMEYPMAFREQSYDYRGFGPMDPRTIDPRAAGGHYRDPYYSDYRGHGHEADLREYQPKESYFSDYRPSQNYPANFRSHDSMNQPITNPNYMKHIIY